MALAVRLDRERRRAGVDRRRRQPTPIRRMSSTKMASLAVDAHVEHSRPRRIRPVMHLSQAV